MTRSAVSSAERSFRRSFVRIYPFVILSCFLFLRGGLALRRWHGLMLQRRHSEQPRVELDGAAPVPHSSSRTLPADLDLASRVPCGSHKCFVRSTSDASTGYLLTPYDPSRAEDGFAQWNATKYLEAQHGVRHFLLEPPRLVVVSSESAERLNAAGFRYKKPWKSARVRFSPDVPVVLQKSRSVRDPALHFGCQRDKQAYALDGDVLQTFLSSAARTGGTGEEVPGETFLHRLREELTRAREVLDMVPWVARDFHLVLDAGGYAHYTDVWTGPFTRDKEGRTPEDWRELCEEAFENLLRGVSSLLAG